MPVNINKIGRYDIVSELGRGAMGVVYKGHDPNIDRFVAIKTLSRQSMDVDSDELEDRFKIEAKAAGRLNHPRIVSIYEFGEDEGQAFIAMEYVEGCTLSELEERGTSLTVSEVKNIVTRVLEALQYAHEQGVVHRDIKPSNIMYTIGGDIKITDFGIARMESSTKTQFGMVIGTLGYMSPEQIMGQRVDHRSDIFSAGILLYELLTGERAFVCANITSTTYKVVHTELPQPSKICPTLPVEFDAVVEKALAKKPDSRFQSALDFANALNSVQVLGEAETVMQYKLLDHDCRAKLSGNTVSGRNETLDALGPNTGPDDVLSDSEQAPTVMEAVGEMRRAEEYSPGKASPTEIGRSHTEFEQDVSRKSAYSEASSHVRGGDQASESSGSPIGWYYKVLIASGFMLVVIIAIILKMKGDVVIEVASNESSDKYLTAPVKEVAETVEQVLPVREEFLPGSEFKDCPSCPLMLVLPAGSFMQGASDADLEREQSEAIQRVVTLDAPIAIGTTEVTRGQFAEFADDSGFMAKGCWHYDGKWKMDSQGDWLSPGFLQDEDHPVTCVSWEDAQAYIGWLSQKTGKKYRLLSESEWEYAARADTISTRSWGDSLSKACLFSNVADQTTEKTFPGWSIHNCSDGYIYTAPVGRYDANDFGVYDMLGSLFEWTDDCWNGGYTGAPVDGSAWTTGDCSHRVLRGGSWFSMPKFVRSASRNRFPVNHRSSSFGFRVAREL